MKLLHIIAANGVPFTVRLVETGDRYGRDDCLTHEPGAPDPMVEFYDRRYPHTSHGQFVSRYFVVTLLQAHVGALCLDGGVPDWSVDEHSLSLVRAWLRHLATSPKVRS